MSERERKRIPKRERERAATTLEIVARRDTAVGTASTISSTIVRDCAYIYIYVYRANMRQHGFTFFVLLI